MIKTSNTMRSALIALGIAGATTLPALAYDSTPINRAQSAQIERIEQARRSGELTRREYRELMAEQGRIARLTENAQADGYVSGREYRSIREAQRDASGHIYQESHDGQVSWWRRWKSSHNN